MTHHSEKICEKPYRFLRWQTARLFNQRSPWQRVHLVYFLDLDTADRSSRSDSVFIVGKLLTVSGARASRAGLDFCQW
jgi:hypothetical protein